MQVAVRSGLVSERELRGDGKNERRMVVIDDDDLSREVLTLIALEAGFQVDSFASGEQAIEALGAMQPPAAILIDMQMPGLSGEPLAERLRLVCGIGTTLLAMSGSPVAQEQLGGYNAFLLKPFAADELEGAYDRTMMQAAADSASTALILNEAVFESLARSMPAERLFGLYELCLADSRKRLSAMRRALESHDDVAYRSAAHAIKGGCGMVGAVELARLAGEMEDAGLPAEHDVTPLDHFLAASARLERMLDSKARAIGADVTAVRPENF